MTAASTLPPTQTKNRPATSFATVYAYAWVALAGVALTYLMVVAFNPALLGETASTRLDAEQSDGHRGAGRFATDVTGLKQSVGELKLDVQAVRTDIAAVVTREKDLAERITVLEERTKPPLVADVTTPAAVVAPKTLAQQKAEQRAQKAAAVAAAAATVAANAVAASPAVAPASAPSPAPQVAPAAVAAVDAASAPAAEIGQPPKVVVLNAPPATSAVVTGTIPAPTAPVTFGPGAVTPIVAKAAAAPAAIEIASGPSLDALRLNWSLLTDRHAAALKNLEARYVSAGEGLPYQLLAGPIGTPEEAGRVCNQLRAKKVTCRVTGFGGNAL